MQAWVLFLVSIERGTSRRVYHRRPWLSDMSQLGGTPCRFLAPLAVTRVGVSDRSRIMSPDDITHDEDGAVVGNTAPFGPLGPG